ncbi:Ku protein [Patescibacteria group bacterium]|nr:Ku protein [Patescibacteria group bacterium]
MKPIWTGGIRFGLIYIPVNLYSGTKDHQLTFHYLDKNDNSRIHYGKYRESDGKEVSKDDIVKGYEYKKGEYVIMEDSDFEKADVKKSNTIDVSSFVTVGEINTKYFDKPYYLEPAENAAEIYALLVQALKKSKKVGVATYVFKTHEHLAALKAEGDMLVLNQLRFATELRDPSELTIPKQGKVKKEELNMAIDIISNMEGKFDPKKYKDSYVKSLKKAIQEKKEKKTITPKGKIPKATEVTDLMKELKKSLEKSKKVKV